MVPIKDIDVRFKINRPCSELDVSRNVCPYTEYGVRRGIQFVVFDQVTGGFDANAVSRFLLKRVFENGTWVWLPGTDK